MSHRCEIQLDNPRGVYRAGDTVNGHVYLTLSERALIKGRLEHDSWAIPYNMAIQWRWFTDRDLVSFMDFQIADSVCRTEIKLLIPFSELINQANLISNFS